MAYKKKINWIDIQAKYELGLSPREIEKEYLGLTRKAITNKAYREGWKPQNRSKHEIKKEKVSNLVQSAYDELQASLDQLTGRSIKVLSNFTVKLEENQDAVTNPYLFDGEKVNTLYQTTLNNATKLALQHIKHRHEQELARQAVAESNRSGGDITVRFVKPDLSKGNELDDA